MKRWLLLLLAVLLVLSGCNGDPVPETIPSTPPQTSETTQHIPGPSLYLADSQVEAGTQGAVQAYLPETGALATYGFMGDDPVLFAYGESEIYVTRISAETGEILAEGTLPGTVSLWEGLALGTDTLVCYDETEHLLRLYDGQFRQTRTLPLPEDVAGSIAVSEDLSTAYYSIGGTLYALELRTELSRLVLQMGDAEVFPEMLLFRDTVLCCTVSGPYDSCQCFFSATDGRQLGQEDRLLSMQTLGDAYVARCADGLVTEVLVGTRGGEVSSFAPDNAFANVGILRRTGRLVEDLTQETGTGLQIYDPETGICLGKLFLEGVSWVGTVHEDAQGRLWFLTTDSQLGADVLCRWDPAGEENGDTLERIGPYYTVDNPNREGLQQCRERADQLEKTYGVEILLYDEAPEPADYAFTPEHQIVMIEAALDTLEKAMARFPEGFFRTAADVTASGAFRISLVREITGTQYNSLPDGSGLQYWLDGNAYMALKTGYGLETAFYHQLCHGLETFVVGNSIHYDFWNDQNPKGFAYDGSYGLYQNHLESPWLQAETRAFIDAFSMTYPMEDRARIFEYAMTEGNEAFFATETMQLKLKQLCMAIREAFGWKKTDIVLPWEQYLQEPLKMK